MPSNQSSPWGGAKLRACSSADSTTRTASVSTHATKVPFSQTSLDLSKRKDQVKPLLSNAASSALPLRQTTVYEVSGWENGERIKTITQSKLAEFSDCSPTLPQNINGSQIPNNEEATGAHQAETSAPSSIHKGESQTGLNILLQKFTSQHGKGQADTGDTPLGLEPFVPVCHQDLFIKGQCAFQQSNNVMVQTAASLRSGPPPYLTRCERQGATKGSPRPDGSKVEIRSTSTTRRCFSAKPTTRFSQTQNGSAANWSSNHFIVRGSSRATSNGKPRATASLNDKNPASEGLCAAESRRMSPPAARPFPKVLRATQEQQLIVPDVIPGPSVGCVTSQISAIQLTKQGQPSSAMSPFTSLIETALSCPESVMQVDGVEEELPDELENACSDDDDSDCLSVDGSLSTASVAVLSGIEEPMLLGTEVDREERPALVPSLFPRMPPTLYFSTAKEKVELLPAEQRRLLKWKMSTVTPNVVKHTITRSHFRVTKKSHDWLGCWGHHMKSPGFKALGEHQKLNHFPGTFQIGRKDRLWRNLSKMQVRFGKREFSFFPRTFILPQDIKLLRKAWEDGGSRQKWIIKPPASARGIGIQVIHKWSQMPRKRPLLVQKYLHKPYLISGNKFDLRIYVYVTSYNPLRIYMFSDGLVRFASCKYSSSMKTLSNKFMHLTNYSVNKKNSEYQTNSDDKACQGHKWALKALWNFLGSKGINTTLIWEKIKDIVIKTIIASEPYVNSLLKMHLRTPYSCHELFGFDIMLDENLKPWILEVNISPSLHSNTALDVSIKGQMIRDLLNLAGFHIPLKEDVVAPSSCSTSSSTSSLCVGNREKTRPDLSADEKVKRAFYLTRRYPDQDFFSSVLEVLTPEDVRVLAESEDEMNRRGEFERVFPSPSSSRYLRFFECPRYLNILLDQWEQKYWNSRAKGISLLSSLCQEGVHLGSSEPDHTWSNMSKFEAHKQDAVSPSNPRVVVTHRENDDEDGSDGEVASVSPSPGSSVTSSACTSPQPSLTQSLLPQQFASL